MQLLRALTLVTASSVPLPAQAAWSRVYPPQSPPARFNALMACFEPLGHTMVLFGNGVGGALTDAWRFDGTTWAQLPPIAAPHRVGGAMVYDSNRQRLVLFGGQGSNWLQDTWEWDGATWTNPNPAVKPPGRAYHGMAFDRRRGVSVVFSGSAGTNVAHQDLWEWNGSTWTQRTPTAMPAARDLALMAFDPATETVLMTGGVRTSTAFMFLETWTWDGTAWQLLQPSTPPLPHLAGRLCADLHRRRVILSGDNTDPFTWEWDGTQWTQRMQTSPGPRNTAGLAYDPLHRSTVLFGGEFNSALDDTWVFRTPNPADVSTYGNGCAGPAGLPQLQNAPYSHPWLGDTFRSRVMRATPIPFAVFVTGAQSVVPPVSLAVVGMAGCDQHVMQAVTDLRVAGVNGVEWSLAIPNTPSLLNATLFQQAFAPDAGANTLGLTASNGIRITTGIR